MHNDGVIIIAKINDGVIIILNQHEINIDNFLNIKKLLYQNLKNYIIRLVKYIFEFNLDYTS